ncbi:MAG: YvcK family protein [Planctomycetes bacterium]|nr:YvcK family protein [Planctomycetota bacterium]
MRRAAARRPRIVCLGGGTGQSVLLRGLSALPCELTGIVGVTDNGGHAGVLRRELGGPAVGDLRNCLGALAGDEPWGRVFRFRFGEGGLSGVSLGNLLLAALSRELGGLSAAAEAARVTLGLRPAILPVSEGAAQVCARVGGAKVVAGEWEIIERRPRTPITRVFHRPPLRATREVLGALRRADLAVLCPGSLFTAVLSVLAVRGVAQALARVPVLAVTNLMTQPGQTDGMDWVDQLLAIERGLGKLPEFALVNDCAPPAKLAAAYAGLGSYPAAEAPGRWRRLGPSRGGWETVECIGGSGRAARSLRVRFADLVERPRAAALRSYARSGARLKAWPHLIRHDPARLALEVHRAALRLLAEEARP